MFNNKLKKELFAIKEEKKQVINILEEQTANIEEITATIEELNANTQEVNNMVSQSKESGQKNILLVNNINNSVSNLNNNINTLSEYGNTINAITRTINDISNKTNLLALNASIEAAKAGEVGLGFTVIAREVDNLSKGVKDKSVDIENIINKVLNTIEVLKEEVKHVVEGVNHFKKDTESRMDHVENIFNATSEITLSTEQLAQVAQHQAVVLQDIISKKLKSEG